jgi:hypothetical protein
MWQVKNMVHKFIIRGLLLAGTSTLLACLALGPTVSAQIAISINPPVCSYGYYDYAPYGCAPVGFYGPGYFFNGIFLGVGPWANWGYGHGWGGHRFSGGGGGSYVAGRGNGGGALIQPIVDVDHRLQAPGAAADPTAVRPDAPVPQQSVALPMVPPMLQQHVVARPIAPLIPQQHVVARLTARLTAAETNHMVTANITSR